MWKFAQSSSTKSSPRSSVSSFDDWNEVKVKQRCQSEAVVSVPEVTKVKHRSQSDATVRMSETASNVTEEATPAESPVDPILLLGENLAQKSMIRMYHYLQLNGVKETECCDMNWLLQVSKPNMHVFTSAMRHTCWNAIKAVTVIKASLKNLMNLLLSDARMGEYDEMFDRHEPIHVSNSANIRRVLYKGVWPTTPRDFIICTTHEMQPDGSVLIATISAPDSLSPINKDYVRGNVQISGYHLQPYSAQHALSMDGIKNIGPGECKVTLIAHTELGGSLPASIINCLSTNAPVKILTQVTEIMKRTPL